MLYNNPPELVAAAHAQLMISELWVSVAPLDLWMDEAVKLLGGRDAPVVP